MYPYYYFYSGLLTFQGINRVNGAGQELHVKEDTVWLYNSNQSQVVYEKPDCVRLNCIRSDAAYFKVGKHVSSSFKSI